MTEINLSRRSFIDRVLTSSLPGQVAKRFAFADGEVAALYTLSRKVPAVMAHPIILVVAIFPLPERKPGYTTLELTVPSTP